MRTVPTGEPQHHHHQVVNRQQVFLLCGSYACIQYGAVDYNQAVGSESRVC